MERNNDNDYTKDTAELQPDFILREPAGDKPADSDGIRKAIDPLAPKVETDTKAETTAKPEVGAKPEPEMEAGAENAEEQVSAEMPSIGASGPQARDTMVISSAERDRALAQEKERAMELEKERIIAMERARTAALEKERAAALEKERAAAKGSELRGPSGENSFVLSNFDDPKSLLSADGFFTSDRMGDRPPTSDAGRRLTASRSGSSHYTSDAGRRPPASGAGDSTVTSGDKPAGETKSRSTSVYSDSIYSGSGKEAPRRPRFENPSFDDGSGQTSGYRDPRRNFRKGESASWQSGQSVDEFGSGYGKRRRKAPRPVTMSKKVLGLLVAGCLMLSALCGFGGVMVGSTLVNNSPTSNSSQTEAAAGKTEKPTTETAGYTLESSTGSGMTVKDITAAAKDSVVEIRTESAVSDSWMQDYVMEGAGSGVIFSDDGYIMTNNHVISGARKITVTTADEQSYEAQLIGTDENNDVAVLKIDANDLKAATLGNSDELEVGDLAVAIGNPLGELGGTVTAGIISAKDRALSIDGKTLHLLQTDSSINPGNSGGGLFNDDGQLIGLVVAKSSGSGVEGLGFAIPINTAANVAYQLMDKGYVSGQPSTGMSYQEGSTNGGGFGSFESLFGSSSKASVYIYSVNGNNAKKAGFQPGDIVLAVDGEEITSFDDLSAIVTSHKVGDELKFTIQRDGAEKEISLVLEEKEAPNNNEQSGGDQDGNQQPGTDQGDNQQPDIGQGDEFSPFPEDQGGSLFDYFFGN